MKRESSSLPWLAPLAVGLLTFIVFLPALQNGFVWDDFGFLVNNPSYRGLGWKELRWMFTTMLLGNYHPLSWLTFGLDYTIWGMDPFGYHLTNVLLHTANALLFYLLALRLLSSERPRPEDFLGAACAALIFSLHPLRVESVAWVSERRDVLSGFFFLVTLLFWLRALRGRERPDRLWSALAWSAYLLALLSKAIVVTLPVLLMLMDLYPLRRLAGDPREWLSPRYRALWKEKIPFLLLAAIFAAVGVVGQARSGALAPLSATGWSERLAQSLFGLSYYLGKTLLPLRLTPVYFWHWRASPTPYLLSGGCALTVAGILTASRRSWPAGLAAFGYYAISLVPVIGLLKIGHQTVADRYSYLACLSWALLAGAGMRRLAQSRRANGNGRNTFVVGGVAMAAALTSLSLLSRRQIQAWHDPAAFWRHVLDLDPMSLTARGKLGEALAQQNRAGEAALLWEETSPAASRRQDVRAKLYNDAGADLLQKGEIEKAAAYFEQALKLDPGLSRAHGNLGIALAREGKLNEAIEEFEAALRLDPGYEPARANLRKARQIRDHP